MANSEIYDMVIIGGGPAGFTAGLYAARSRLKTLLVERMGFGGQLLTYEKVENYPGFPEGITSFALVELFTSQAFRFGLESRNGEVVGLDLAGPVKLVRLADGQLKARTIIIATGCTPRKLGVPGEVELTGRGVSYCAVCDGPFFRDQDVAVVGGGDTAVEEAIYLTRFARRVYLIHRRDRLRAVQVVQEQALRNDKIQPVWDTVVTEIHGGPQGVEALTMHDKVSGKSERLPANGVFVFVGMNPNTGFLPSGLERDAAGFVVTDGDMACSIPGVFAAGDVRSKSLRQIVTAVGDGATAAYNAERYLEAHS
ncbi:MAG TPA: thioredoxin-disulfide reductase [Syntrophobacteraceae bacterium]|nr:thioredoxin-disulfide reductase [Syntrophobacteraceae bacterium]HBZ53808.1 thioredoxin-disulfide reductase [Syntrophobacteraceae bacterium]